ncbi:2OG-Fe(II) oxygenase [Paraburkholderia caballeronis]|uniref:Proline 4-hydroxylase (Includes Rps23 Pro-64 3,4-dihydroxylase Tpa1), contains SM-20 domain n=1 Tax=Paraburkholderia caballeronis TaxID=416943 RepID=A0A1H7SGE7_9BURK|nr:2OG-Fe(II) oxygenase [Paraburkholderia caballeronis]PXW22291.1 Rps23 Pro-64 3,4-dihydroxylase Tpa1-like proline 4-hydroxylase [Paraburkholderia caballeronis]PXW95950.1 Rps23 Pro-64 3,4-dihydroxylase Tpa1-like proline 4-hydroxylase [Paraburkholderia caballeronis]RAJ92316.1 Rps23 Pro-64 3,4-dihydroxylase Tpa1-like proline 4-hydroxylase [Paraburkholderia caballeronis]SEB52866.1 Proline 4-hydroxylase (includes Rps23 Pro-64 3,4-dihydroxylase Tpa1), contains SM-20 domain [Paraburkholderia caballer
MTYLDAMDAKTAFISPEAARGKGAELQTAYADASPFPHVVIDDFLPPELADRILGHFASSRGGDDLNMSYDRAQERFKSSYHPDTLAPELRAIFYAFNSRPFLQIVENLTGIKGLIPDPYFFGGGLHEIRQGGHLSIHADFNHHMPLDLERRINLLIYLNKDWKDEYGGQLELWDTAMTKRHHSIVPAFNRCVIFNTTSKSMHGNPQPVSHPGNVSRKSVALYYYTATWDGSKRSHTTQFKVRPNSGDEQDWTIRLREWRQDLLPPVVNRQMGNIVRRFRKVRSNA